MWETSPDVDKLARLKASHYILVLRSANLSGSQKKEIPMHLNYKDYQQEHENLKARKTTKYFNHKDSKAQRITKKNLFIILGELCVSVPLW